MQSILISKRKFIGDRDVQNTEIMPRRSKAEQATVMVACGMFENYALRTYMVGRILDESDDLDLVAELAYCYLVLNTRKKWVRKAIDRILVTQNPNGAWGTKEELHLGMYDRMHGTWTAVTALCHSLSRQAP